MDAEGFSDLRWHGYQKLCPLNAYAIIRDGYALSGRDREEKFHLSAKTDGVFPKLIRGSERVR